MAWQMVNYSCGHSERQQFYGKQIDRDSRQAWMERGLCPDCYKAQKALERAKEIEVATAQAKDSGLPELVGSEKQIAWAITIRKNALAAPYNTIISQDAFGKLSADSESKAAYAVTFAARKKLETETSAKWFIDNRDELDMYCLHCGKAALINK
jgi:hypothetical protein